MVLAVDARERLLQARKLQIQVVLKPDAFDVYRELLDVPGLSFDEARGSWLAVRYADVERILLDTKNFSSQRTLMADGSVDEVASGSILGLDPPRHRHLRQLMLHSFTHRRVAELEPRIEAITAELLDAMDGRSSVDLVEALAFPLPVIVIAELLGVPVEDTNQFRQWAGDLVGPDFALRMKTFQRFAEYFDGLVDSRRRTPTGDLISDFLKAEVDGARLEQRDITSACTLLLLAGHETTASLIPSMLWALEEHPAARQELSSHPELMPGAIEEALRYRGVVHFIPRVVTRDMELDGCRLREGDAVLPMLAAANHDPRQFPNPERFDIRRSPNRHFGFGHGIHLCLGASLARLELAVVMKRLNARFPRLIRDRSRPLPLRPSWFLFSFQEYHVTLNG